VLSGKAYAEDESALEDDADSVAVASFAGSIIAALVADSIALVSYPGDYEDISILPLFDNDSEPHSVAAAVPAPHRRLHGNRRCTAK
jgi:hypothetical protein